MPPVLLRPMRDPRPLRALARSLHQGLGMLARPCVAGLDPLAVQSISLSANQNGARLWLRFGPNEDTAIQTLRPGGSLSRPGSIFLRRAHPHRMVEHCWDSCPLDGLVMPAFEHVTSMQVAAGHRMVEHRWDSYPLEGLVMPAFEHATSMQVAAGQASWTSKGHHKSGHDILHGFGQVVGAHEDAGARARLLHLMQGRKLACIPGEDTVLTGHARLQARADRQAVLAIFRALNLSCPDDTAPIFLARGPGQVSVGLYQDSREVVSVFAVS